MSDVTRLIVVRHGNTFNSGDVILRVGSATDIPLTENVDYISGTVTPYAVDADGKESVKGV